MARRRRDLPATSLRVTPRGYEPISAFDQEIHARYRIGSMVEADLHQNKSNDLLKLYWGFLAYVVKATGKFGDARSLSNAILVEAGHVERFTALYGGGMQVHPASIGDMDGPEFKSYAENAFALIWTEFGIDVETYKEHLRGRNF